MRSFLCFPTPVLDLGLTVTNKAEGENAETPEVYKAHQDLNQPSTVVSQQSPALTCGHLLLQHSHIRRRSQKSFRPEILE